MTSERCDRSALPLQRVRATLLLQWLVPAALVGCGAANQEPPEDGSPPLDAGPESDSPGSTDASVHSSPVRVWGSINTYDPVHVITDAQLEVLATRFDFISGLDNHGYDPSAIDRLPARHASVPVICMAQVMDHHAVPLSTDDRSAIDAHEEAFFHGTDPAALHVVAQEGETFVWFRQDGRAPNPSYEPGGVDHYVVEIAASEDGPWTALAEIAHEAERFVYVHIEPGIDESQWMRVQTVFAGLGQVAFSWPQRVLNQTTAFPVAVLSGDPTGAFYVVCQGQACPNDPDEVLLEVDTDLDRSFGESGEFLPAATAEVMTGADGRSFTLYSGAAGVPGVDVAYRIRLASGPDVVAPRDGGSFAAPRVRGFGNLGHYNNRLTDRFGSQLIQPDFPEWRSIVAARLERCLAQGYDGMRLDFAHDDIEQHWVSTVPVAPRERAAHARLRSSVSSFLQELRASAPDALLAINGFFVVRSRESHAEYLESVSGSDFEFFAYSTGRPGLLESTSEALEGILASRAMGKLAFAKVGASFNDTLARMNSLALYLLIADEGTYFFLGDDGADQHIPYFPEWDVPLGEPMEQITDPVQLAHSSGILGRQFENGWVFFNHTPESRTVTLDRPAHLFRVTGGLIPELGGDGAAVYEDAVQTITIEPARAAVLLYEAP